MRKIFYQVNIFYCIPLSPSSQPRLNFIRGTADGPKTQIITIISAVHIEPAAMADDWNTVTILRGKQAKPGAAKSAGAVNAARRRGEAVNTEKKFGAGGNTSGATHLNTAKLDAESEELKHKQIDLSVGKWIQKGRQAKEMSQKDLATKICEKIQVVTEYESGKAVNPNPQILGKMERVLEIKLRGKDKGQPIAPKKK